jgi:hypothetical protein
LEKFTLQDGDIVTVFGCSTIRDLTLPVKMKQFVVVARALQTASSRLTHLDIRCVYEYNSRRNDGLVASSGALSLTSIRSLYLASCAFNPEDLEACLDSLPRTKLSCLCFDSCNVWEDEFSDFMRLDQSKHRLDWKVRFPDITDRFCLIKVVG